MPLSERLGLTPITTYSVGQEAQLVSEILHSSGIVLISWEHKAITEKIAPDIAGEQKIEDLPHKWHETRYDVVLRFDRMSPDAPDADQPSISSATLADTPGDATLT